MIDKLTPEQEALIPVYREKWRAIALSTKPIDCEKAADAVKSMYAAIGQQEPKIVFFDSPYAAYQNLLLIDSLPSSRSGLIGYKVYKEIEITFVVSKLKITLWYDIGNLFRIEYKSYFMSYTGNEPRSEWTEEEEEREGYISLVMIRQEDLAEEASRIDYCISGLSISCKENQYKWESYQSVAENCGCIFAFPEICYACNRPPILSFDSQQRLHAEGSPAIQFADGFSVYAYHGVRLPEKYGKVHPQHWPSEWLLSEDNAELRRVLIQGIDYEQS